ncbi:MAG: helix-turn-helix domain-containing protein [Ruminococcaceae bacterium]|nr:helix-turn-helix domain-containing protein [Oscillospiraceae bacterium]
MDSKSVGGIILKLRKQNGWTQSEVAEMLGISAKTVSKWESGYGFPDVTLFPKMSELFGVSIDYLMLGEERGITVAGSTLVDIVNNIDEYPKEGMLVHIHGMKRSVGGCMPNTAINLAKIDRRIPVSVLGKVGNDENGRLVVSTLTDNGIDVSKMCYTSQTPTGFCNVMSVPSGERTFFLKMGTNSEFSPEDIDINLLNCNILHIGYIMLLDKFDEEDKQYGTAMAAFLSKVQKRGIKTSIDIVSDNAGNYGKKVIPALKYCNYVIINETECCGIWGLDAYDGSGKLNVENIQLAMQKCLDGGVRDLVVVHCKERAFSLNTKGHFNSVSSLKMPKEQVKGSVGAGDAFCAGCLYALYNDYTDVQMLEFASAAAACSLLEANSIDGMKPRNEILMLAEKYGRL